VTPWAHLAAFEVRRTTVTTNGSRAFPAPFDRERLCYTHRYYSTPSRLDAWCVELTVVITEDGACVILGASATPQPEEHRYFCGPFTYFYGAPAPIHFVGTLHMGFVPVNGNRYRCGATATLPTDAALAMRLRRLPPAVRRVALLQQLSLRCALAFAYFTYRGTYRGFVRWPRCLAPRLDMLPSLYHIHNAAWRPLVSTLFVRCAALYAAVLRFGPAAWRRCVRLGDHTDAMP